MTVESYGFVVNCQYRLVDQWLLVRDYDFKVIALPDLSES